MLDRLRERKREREGREEGGGEGRERLTGWRGGDESDHQAGRRDV